MADEPEKGKETVSYDGRNLYHYEVAKWRSIVNMHIYNHNVGQALDAYEIMLGLVIKWFKLQSERDSCMDAVRKIRMQFNLLNKFPSSRRESELMRAKINEDILQSLKTAYMEMQGLMNKYRLTLSTFLEEEKGWDKTLDKLRKQFQNYK